MICKLSEQRGGRQAQISCCCDAFCLCVCVFSCFVVSNPIQSNPIQQVFEYIGEECGNSWFSHELLCAYVLATLRTWQAPRVFLRYLAMTGCTRLSKVKRSDLPRATRSQRRLLAARTLLSISKRYWIALDCIVHCADIYHTHLFD